MLGLLATAFGVAIYLFVGYLIVRSNLPNKGTIDVLAWLPVAMPGILLGLGLLWLMLGTPLRSVLYGSTLGLAMAIVISHMAVGTQQMKSGLMQISPDLELSARTCGARHYQAQWHILLPILGPSVVSGS